MPPAPASPSWDLAVVGGGTAGIVGARTAAGLGARVVLIERDRIGGDCLWTGCVPSKALLAVAARVALGTRSGRLGVTCDGVKVDFPAVMAHVRRAIATIEPHDSPASLAARGVEVLVGNGRLAPDGDVLVDGRRVGARQVLLATGSSPAVPAVPGLRQAEPLTTDTVWDLEHLPGRLTVLGGGSIGCELGQAFARLGSRVTVVEKASRLLPEEDPDASGVVVAALRCDGVEVYTSTTVTAVTGTPTAGAVWTESGREIEHDALLVTTGRRPGTADLALENAGVQLDRHGFVLVDRRLRTTHPRVWAAGDLTGHPQFTHVAGVHASIAASNAVLGLRRRVDTAVVPRVTYTDPEVAAVGVPTPARDDLLRTFTQWHADVDRAVTEGQTTGFTRLVTDVRGRLVGASIVGPRAGESLAELALAVKQGLRTRDLAGTIHAYPTYADGAWNAALDDVRRRLEGRVTAAVCAAAVRGRSRWVDARRRLVRSSPREPVAGVQPGRRVMRPAGRRATGPAGGRTGPWQRG